jgi:hypothetical protein
MTYLSKQKKNRYLKKKGVKRRANAPTGCTWKIFRIRLNVNPKSNHLLAREIETSKMIDKLENQGKLRDRELTNA